MTKSFNFKVGNLDWKNWYFNPIQDDEFYFLKIKYFLIPHFAIMEFMVRTHSIFAKSNFYSSALGLYAHCGNSYGGKNDSEVQKVRDDTIAEINEVAQHLIKNGVPVKHQGTKIDFT